MAEIGQAVKAHAKPHYESEVIEYLANMPQPVIAALQASVRLERWSWPWRAT